MRLKSARVRNYRSIKDTAVFEIENAKTILVGPNEAGKSAVLQALQHINPPASVTGFKPLRDYPRSLYSDITTGRVDPANVPVVTATFELDDKDRASIPARFRGCGYEVTRYLDNHCTHNLIDGPGEPNFGELRKVLLRLASHVDARVKPAAEGEAAPEKPSVTLASLLGTGVAPDYLTAELAASLNDWLDHIYSLVDESNTDEENRVNILREVFSYHVEKNSALTALDTRTPVFVLFSNYFRVRPLIHLSHLADRLESGSLNDAQYDYGNACLLKLLGFTARALSDLGRVPDPASTDAAQLQSLRDQLDTRHYQLNAASVQLTEEIQKVWNPSTTRPEANRLLVTADGQYLKVVVEDELGVQVELDQRSEGFQWLVSFFVVFFAEASGQHENAILLLDEPGLSLHALKQREFRQTITRLSATNQTIYTTHSPFLVGPDELDLVRVVELNDRRVGTKVHTAITSSDPAALLPLQEALGYDLAQSLFAQQRNLVLEGLTDLWYLEAVAALIADAGIVKLNDKIAKVPTNTAGKVVYYATILHAQKLKVAALLDSDTAGDQAAQQDVLVHTLGQKGILRTKDYVVGVGKAEIEDLLRDTLPVIARDLGWDVVDRVNEQTGRPLVDILSAVSGFSKYKLAKAFMRWSRDHDASDLSERERSGWSALITAINAALK